MINLLPPAERRLVQADYRRRRWVTIGFLVLALLVVAIINLSSLFLVLLTEARGLAGNLATAQAQAEQGGTATVAKSIADLNRQLGQLHLKTGENQPASRALVGMIGQLNSQIKLSNLNYNRTPTGELSLNLSGTAATRQALLDFIKALRQNQTFAAVGSPVSNLIKDRNSLFTLQLKVHESR